MSNYGLDISQITKWTYPQLRLLDKHRRGRERESRRWQLMVASGTLAPEMLDQLWQSVGGEALNLESQPTTTMPSASGKIGQQSHGVDRSGNVVAPAAPLLSDIALGKSVAPRLIPIKVVDKNPQEEKNGPERPDATGAGGSAVSG